MSANNPQIEQETIWGYTKEEIERRWKIHQKFDIVNRAFGSSSDSDKEAKPTQTNNSEQMLSMLERMLTQAPENPENPEETPA
jgi:hypothetical protein